MKYLITIMVFLAFQLSVFGQTDVTTDIIPDPGFESGNATGWYFASDFGHLHADDGGIYDGVFSITSDSADVAVGKYAAKIYVEHGINMWEMGPRTDSVPAQNFAGKTLTISFRIKKTWPDETTQEDNAGIGKVMMKAYANGVAIGAHNPIEGLPGTFGFGNGEVLVDNGADYKVAGFQFTVPDGTTELQIGFWMGKYGTYYLDDFQIYEGGVTPALTKPEMPQEFQTDPTEGTETDLLWLNNSEVVSNFVILQNGFPIDTLDADQEIYEVTGLDANTKYTFGIFSLNGEISSDTATTVFNPNGLPPTKYTVTFHDLTNKTVKEANDRNNYMVELPEQPTRYGYVFDGWFTEQNGEGTEFTSETVVEKDMWVYAHYVKSSEPSNDVTTDLISNPGFEDDTLGWELYPPEGSVAVFTATSDTANVAEGSKAGKVEVTTGVNFWEMPLKSDSSTVDFSGKTLAISFKAKKLWDDGADPKKTIIKVKHPGGALFLTPIEDNGFANGECYFDENNQDEYKLYGFEFTVPDSVKTGLYVELWVGALGTYYFDDFQVYEGISPVFVEDIPTVAEPPSAPSDLTSSEVSSSTLKLNWTDNADDEDGFVISRNGSVMDTVGANVTEFIDEGIESGTGYVYSVYAFNSVGNSAKVTHTVSTTTGIKQQIADNISIAPNPATEIIKVKLVSGLKKGQLVLYNAIGAKVKSMNIDDTSVIMNVNDLVTGIYYLTIQAENMNGVITKKVVIRND